ncbi:hypothetical protein [Roseivirga sp.]|uniref:hypothetical protein n=1 Tax=Roseivirga sp. TaxID=1964215 RepID=UPI003B51CEDD
MKWRIIIWLLILPLTPVRAQQNDIASVEDPINLSVNSLKQFLSIYSAQNEDELVQKFSHLVERLEKVEKRRKSDYAFLRSIFYKTHNSLLTEYDRLATMQETLNDGQFGCLTGTAIYAIILQHFGYDYRIIELPNHVFIHLELDNKSYVFESTLPFNGFMRTTVEMEQLLKQPWLNHRRISQLTTVGEWFSDFKTLPNQYKTIDLKQLAGLQYFNESAKFYLSKDYVNAMEMVMKAYELYPSERNEKLMQLIINKILKYDLIKEDLKNRYLEKYITSVRDRKLSQTK